MDEAGGFGCDVADKLHSQVGYLLFFAEKQILDGKAARVVLWDLRSHRLKRVGNSSFTVETYGLDECVDVGQLLRGYLAELFGLDLLDKKGLDRGLEEVSFFNVTEAKDTYDRVISDKNTLGSRRSLALTLVWLKQQFRGRISRTC